MTIVAARPDIRLPAARPEPQVAKGFFGEPTRALPVRSARRAGDQQENRTDGRTVIARASVIDFIVTKPPRSPVLRLWSPMRVLVWLACACHVNMLI